MNRFDNKYFIIAHQRRTALLKNNIFLIDILKRFAPFGKGLKRELHFFKTEKIHNQQTL